MRRVFFAQFRANAARMMACCIAIVLGTAFVATTFGLVASSNRAVLDAVAAQYSSAAAVVNSDPTGTTSSPTTTSTSAGGPVSALQTALASLTGQDGIGPVVADVATMVEVGRDNSSATTSLTLQSTSPTGPLRWERAVNGRLPAAPGEVAVSGPSGLSIGDTVTAQQVALGDVSQIDESALPSARLRVVGVVDLGADPRGGVGARLYGTAEEVQRLGGTVRQLRVATRPTRTAEATLLVVRRVLAAQPATAPLVVQSGADVARTVTQRYTGGTVSVTAALLVFVVIALVVAGLVIANTFAVVLAQRVRELALLRCIGASRGQIGRSVLAEALLVGAVASIAGAALGAGLTAVLSTVLGHLSTRIPLGAVVVPFRGMALAVALGTVTTVAAAVVPAHKATHISPLAALRPLTPLSPTSTGGAVQLAVGLGLGISSLGTLLVTAFSGQLVPAVIAGVVNFGALLLILRNTAPLAVAATGRLFTRLGGPAADIAARNAARHPRRTAACLTALLIGVTLTAAVVVGSAATKATASAQLTSHYPVDVTITAQQPLPETLIGRLSEVAGVAEVAAVRTADLRIGSRDETALVLDAQATHVVRAGSSLVVPVARQVVIDYQLADDLGVTDGSAVRVAGDRASLPMTVVIGSGTDNHFVVNGADLAALTAHAPLHREWLRLDDGLDDREADAAVTAVTRLSAAQSTGVDVTASVNERRGLNQILDALLLVVSALLAVSVAIAALGVGNTLALSVAERRHESGLLRALGFTRRQLAGTLIWEAAFISSTAAILGCVLGIGYGNLGVRAVLGQLNPALPGRALATVALLSILAGVSASLAPALATSRSTVVNMLAVT